MKKILDPKNLPYAGAIVQAILFSIAGNEYFPVFGWLVGLGVGAVVNYSVAFAASRISDIAKSRKPLAYLSLLTLFAVSPVIICSTLGWTVATFSWSVACDLSIILAGSIAGKSLIVADTPQKSAQPKAAKIKPRSAEIKCRNAAAGCGRVFATQNSANAHARSCKYRKIVIDESLLIHKDK
jgi:MFS family permease